MRQALLALALGLFAVAVAGPDLARAAEPAAPPAPPVSKQTEKCLGCHEAATPGIVADWRASRHSTVTPEKALTAPALERRMSAASVPEPMAKVVVGCFECHGQHAEAHQDNFGHYGQKVNVIVTPKDCATCHTEEAAQYAGSKKAHAVGNLTKNPVFAALMNTATSLKTARDGRLAAAAAGTDAAKAASCLACHGTEIKVRGLKTIELEDGPVKVPDLEGWPNHGVGRINPDGSLGACTTCHPRHGFSIEVARKPHTCGQCHLAPDVPAYEVWSESKHGNLTLSLEEEFHWNDVPWIPGQDFRAPTCSSCHNALLADRDGNVLAPRTHDFGSRLWVRLFGLPYTHAQPVSGDTSILKNKDGLPLPTSFAGEPVATGLIDAQEQARRKAAMGKVCGACHSTSYTQGHFAKLDASLAETDQMTLAATRLMQTAWNRKLADKTNPFDEPLEMKWVEQWLFHANATRLSAAMAGQDMAAFKAGWWNLTKNLKEMEATVAGKK
ncbi:MAG TPA: multiheme c-type cytochrome [Myxococcales bacterium]